jgi:hypothetical protein
VALFGLLGPNGVFLYWAFARHREFHAALTHPVALALMIEAFVMVALLAIWLAKRPLGPWGWRSFVAMSLLGGLGFAAPMIVLLNARPTRAEP